MKVTYKSDLTWGDWMEIAKVARKVAEGDNLVAAVSQIALHPEVLSTLVVLSTNLDAEAFAATPLEEASGIVQKALESTGFFGKLAAVFRSLASAAPGAQADEEAKAPEAPKTQAAGTTKA